ncbi:MAG: thrombospondin type 3 repeat-containing protein, partial [Nanoarchaeota archaeon]
MKKITSLLIIVVIFFLIIAGVVEANKNQNEIVIITNSTQINEAREIVDFIRNNGGDVSQVFIPKVIIGELSVDLEQIILDKYPNRIIGIYHNQINDSILIGDSLSQTAIRYWNSKLEPKLQSAYQNAYTKNEPGPILNDALIPLDRKQKDNLTIGTIDQAQPFNNIEKPSQAPPSDTETSEYMYGDVLASIILLESNGSFDTSTENWTTTEETNVDNEIANGLIWWRARRPSNVNLTFWVYANHYKIPTKYESINRPQSDEGLWIGETMDYLGVSSGNYFSRVRKYADTIRDANNMNWAFTIFVVDSSNDVDGKFSDGYFAYAYLGGPFLVMTYKNGGYGIDNMDAVTAHETGHIFRALDQYASSGCTCTEISGFLNVSNQNCESSCLSNVASIMRGQVSPFTNNAVDSYAKGQIGWRDLDSDGINDAIDSTYNGDTDTDGDGIVNYWDTDDDNDGVLDVNDNCQTTQGPSCNNGCPDTTKPTINISSPINNSKYQNYSIEIKLNSSDLCLDKVWFNDESQNIFLNSPYQTTKNFTEGSHTIIAYANDTSGNVN